MDIRLVTDANEWNGLVDRFDGSYFHYFEWNKTTAEYNAHQFEPIGAYQGDVLIDIFPLIYECKKKTGDSQGCLLPENIVPLFKHVLSKYNLSFLNLTSRLHLGKMEHTVCSNYYEMISEIGMFDSIESFLKPLRYIHKNYRKALKSGITVTSTSQTTDFYRFYRAMVKRNNAGTVFPLQWFETIIRDMGKNALLKTALLNGKSIGSALVFSTKRELFNYFPVIDYRFRKLQAGTLLTVELFKDAIAAGAKRVNLGPDVTGSPTFEFKKHFGAFPQPYFRYQYAQNNVNLAKLRVINSLRGFILKSPRLFTFLRRMLRA